MKVGLAPRTIFLQRLGIFWLSVIALIPAFYGCASISSDPQDAKKEAVAPAISKDMPLDEALEAAIHFGGDTARQVRKLIVKRKEWPAAEKYLVQAIDDGMIKYENRNLSNAVMLYVSGPVKPSAVLFRKMVGSGRPLARQLGWQMAGALSGKVMSQAIEQELTRALTEGEETELLIPQMAMAVQANRLVSAYTMVRQGLMTTGHEDFATAMAVLSPERASDDFLDYLALCPAEELRQMSVSSINVLAANVALNHFLKFPPRISHPQLENLFYFAISRNPALSELGGVVTDHLASMYRSQLAMTLSRLPVWAQVAYIETVRRNLTQTRRTFLSELKKTSPQAEVSEELGEFKL